MRLQRTLSKSVRIPKQMQRIVGREIVRLSLNPVLYSRSCRMVRWERNLKSQLKPQEVICRAVTQYPKLSLSLAVEAVLLDLIEQGPSRRLSGPETEELKRFARLPLSKKIRITRKRMRTYHYLLNLPWRLHEGRKRV